MNTNLLKDPQTNWKYILIVVVLAIIVSGGILGYTKDIVKDIISLSQFVEIKKPERAMVLETETLEEMVQNKECTKIDPIVSANTYTYKLFDKGNNHCATFVTPGDPLIASGKIKITSYNWNSSYFLNAVKFTIDSQGGYIGTHRIAPGQVRGFTIPFDEIRSATFDISWVEVANPDETGIGSVAIKYLSILNTGYLDLNNTQKEHTAWVGGMNGDESWAEVELILNMVPKAAVKTVKEFMEARFRMDKDQSLSYLTENAIEQFLAPGSDLTLIDRNFSKEGGLLYPDFEVLKIEETGWASYSFIIKIWGARGDWTEKMSIIPVYNIFYIHSVELPG